MFCLNLPVWVLESKKVLVVSTVIVPIVPSIICADESLLPLYLFFKLIFNHTSKYIYKFNTNRHTSSLWELCLRKFLHRIISSVVDCLRNPRAIKISSVVDWRLFVWRILSLDLIFGHGLASLDEQQLLDSNERESLAVDEECLCNLFLCLGLVSSSVWESLRLSILSGLKLSRRLLLSGLIWLSPLISLKGIIGRVSSKAVACLRNFWVLDGRSVLILLLLLCILIFFKPSMSDLSEFSFPPSVQSLLFFIESTTIAGDWFWQSNLGLGVF